MTTGIEYVMPNPDQLARLATLVHRLSTGIVPRQEVLDIEEQVPDTYLNLYHIGGRGHVPYLVNHTTGLSVRLERVDGGYQERRES